MNRVQNLETIVKSLGGGFINLIDRGFVYGSQGKLLRRNIESLWFDHCVTQPPYNVFLTSSEKFSDTLATLYKTTINSLPFGLAFIEPTKSLWNCHLNSPSFESFSHDTARITVLTDEVNGKDMYHRKQRERKVWWRKYSRNPSRFGIAEAKKIGKSRETIEIIANFSFGHIVVETITYQQDARKVLAQSKEQKYGSSMVHVVEHIASLDWGCLAMLCDGYEVDDDNVGILKIHPKLSPYKAGFYLEHDESTEDRKFQEKSRLIVYLNNLLKSKGLGTVLTRTKRGIEDFHVPLTINVDDSSLETGIVRVRSQLTTISEAVHVTDLPKYIAARCA
ncbi:DNA polymerase subunit gamma-2, mitochondrial [Venturia canescens]|uniref:DNA polymerase subunit gamma-2, mitochondrial n=1 Tax=Venturia canescens TaxID=32260 RepID=UPI001C9CE484|nr:DNA polymerase subunit gamma-2, mitochondrial [Venturia canescens]